MVVLGLVILAGIGLGLWQAEVWPFSSAKQVPSAPPPPSAQAAPRSASNAVVAAVAPTGKTETVSLAPPASAVTPPADTNAVSAEEWVARFEMSRKVMTAQVDRTFPRWAVNREAAVRQMDGLVLRGTNVGSGVSNVTLLVAGKPVAIAFSDIDVHDRLKLDDEFRSMWIDAQAAAFSRQSLEQEGKKLTGLATNSEEDLDRMLSLGDPRVQCQAAEQFYKRKDFTHALLYFQAAAVQNHGVAQYVLGIMYYQGIGVGSDRKEGLTWLALAAAKGHAKAEQFIQQQKISQEARQVLLKHGQVRKEIAIREYEAALKTHQNQSQSPVAVLGQSPGSLTGSNP